MPDRESALWAIIESRDATLARQALVLERARRELAEKEDMIHELDAAAVTREALVRAANEEVLARTREAQAKQEVIREMQTALAAYRAAFAIFGFAIRPLNRFAGFAARPIRILSPELGVLQQYPPRGLRLPPAFARPVPARCPTISIVTPSFRQAQFIERTVLSVLDQAYPRLEYFVQDGASDDGTRAILERHAGRLSGWDSRPDSGQSEAINRGFARTTGEIMGWLNSDDILLPGALACVADFFERHPDVDVVYGHRILIDEEDREIGRWVLPAHDDKVLSWADFVPQETLFWRRAIWEKAGGRVDESFRFAMDWDLLVRFREAGARFARIPRFIGGFRVHARQKTSAGMSEVGVREMDRIRERILGRVPTRAEVSRAVAPYLLRHVAQSVRWKVRQRLGMAS